MDDQNATEVASAYGSQRNAVDTYPKPEHGWTCFHCGETFKTIGGARDHFGAKPDAVPGCMIRVQLGNERGLEMALRRAEDEIARLKASEPKADGAPTARRSTSSTPSPLPQAETPGGNLK